MKRIRHYHFLAVTLGVLSSILWVYFAIVMENVINTILGGDFSSFGKVLLFFVFYVLAIRSINLISELSRICYVNSSIEKLRCDYLAGKHRCNRIKDPSKIISTLSNDINQVKDFYFDNSIKIITQIITFIVSSLLMIQISAIVTMILYGLIAILLLLPKLFEGTIERLQMDVSKANNSMVDKVNDHFLGYDVLRDYDVNTPFLKKRGTSSIGCTKEVLQD